MLYTIMPLEMVLAEREEPPYRELMVSGATLLLEPVGEGMGRIVRLISSCPNDYLRPELEPGRLIPLYKHQP